MLGILNYVLLHNVGVAKCVNLAIRSSSATEKRRYQPPRLIVVVVVRRLEAAAAAVGKQLEEEPANYCGP